jgi:hypothetical protein
MARCQALRIVMGALRELPERTSHVFQMHRIDGVSQRDIASQLLVSPTLVNFMVRDAHNHCRSKLLSHNIDSELVPAAAGKLPRRDRQRPAKCQARQTQSASPDA